MADFEPEQVLGPNFQKAISQELKRVRCWNFQDFLISLISNHGETMKEFWDIRVSSSKLSGWFDMELPFTIFDMRASGLLGKTRETCSNDPQRELKLRMSRTQCARKRGENAERLKIVYDSDGRGRRCRETWRQTKDWTVVGFKKSYRKENLESKKC